MTFATPELLYLIWAVPLVLVLLLLHRARRTRILNNYASPEALNTLVPHRDSTRSILRAACLLGALVLTIVALAGPRMGHTWKTLPRKGVALMVALDCSRSMLASDVKPNRLERAKYEVADLLNMLQGDKVGLVAFAGTAFLQCPLTLDYTAFDLFLRNLGPDYLPVGGTDLTATLDTALKGFNPQENVDKGIIIITDGEATDSAEREAILDKARELAETNVRVFCIGVGSQEGAPIPDGAGGFVKDASGSIVLSKLDEDILQEIASITNGSYVRSVAGDMDLESIYNNHIRTDMTQGEFASNRIKIYKNQYQYPLGGAVLLLLLDILLGCAPARSRQGAATGLLLALMLSGAALALLPTPALALSPYTAGEGLEAYQAGDYAKAQDVYLQQQVATPEDPRVAYNLGDTAYRNGKFAEAATHFEQAATLAHGASNAQLEANARYNLGNTLVRQKKLEQGLAQYEQALKLNPNDQDAIRNHAFVKRMLEQQQLQQQNQDGQQNKDGDQNKDDSQQNDQQKQDKNQSDQNQKQDQQQSDDQQQGQQDQQDQQDKQNGQNGQQDQQQQNQPDQQQSDQQQGQSGDKQQNDQQVDTQPTPDTLPPDQQDQQTQQEAAQSAQATDEQPEGQQDQQQAGGMADVLNKLEDKPGRAFMGRYKKRNIEKDW